MLLQSRESKWRNKTIVHGIDVLSAGKSCRGRFSLEEVVSVIQIPKPGIIGGLQKQDYLIEFCFPVHVLRNKLSLCFSMISQAHLK